MMPVLQPTERSLPTSLIAMQREVDMPRLPAVYCAVQESWRMFANALQLELLFITGMFMHVIKKKITMKVWMRPK